MMFLFQGARILRFQPFIFRGVVKNKLPRAELRPTIQTFCWWTGRSPPTTRNWAETCFYEKYISYMGCIFSMNLSTLWTFRLIKNKRFVFFRNYLVYIGPVCQWDVTQKIAWSRSLWHVVLCNCQISMPLYIQKCNYEKNPHMSWPPVFGNIM